MNTFYWHDYETWGTDPSVDRPSQFAGVRTDENLNIIGEPLILFCRLAHDIWPNPEASLVTGITPQQANQQGISECEFISAIHTQLSQPGTCGAGYNSIRFDDEVTRYTLYRNFFDPYEREWRHGNSRWDIIDMVRLCYAIRPEEIEWPRVEGKPSFKLELLTQANGISHQSAHDAFSDVSATIKLARLIRDKKPELYQYVYQHKSKQQIAALIDLVNRKPLLHISSRFPAEHGCAALVVPLAMHPVNSNAIIAYDLEVDPAPLATLPAQEIHARVFTAQQDLPEHVSRLPLKLIHINKCPVLATPKLLDHKIAKRLHIDKDKCERHWHAILKMDIAHKLTEIYKLDSFVPDPDPERRLYDGFVGDRDKHIMADLRTATREELSTKNFVFEDRRLNAMLLPYKARNYPDTLTAAEQAEWQEVVRQRLLEGGRGRLSVRDLLERLQHLQQQHQSDAKIVKILNQFRQYVESIAARYSLELSG